MRRSPWVSAAVPVAAICLILVSGRCRAQTADPDTTDAATRGDVSNPDEAEEAAGDSPETAGDGQATPEQLAQWIEELESAEFRARQSASHQLAAAGAAAIEMLREATLSDQRETAQRAFEILRTHFRSADPELQQAARAALEQLAESDHESMARRAHAELHPRPQEAPLQPGIANGRLQVQIRGMQGMQVQMANGARRVQVRENNRRVTIEEAANGKITVTLEEPLDAQPPPVRKFEADSVEALQQNHPEGHALYQRYRQGVVMQLGPRIQIGGLPGRFPLPVPGPPGLVPGAVPARPLPLESRTQVARRLDEIAEQLEAIEAQLRESADQQALPEDVQEAVESLEATRTQLQDVRRRLAR